MDRTPETRPRTDRGNPPEGTALRRIRADDWARRRALRLEMLADTPIAFGETLAAARARSDSSWVVRTAVDLGSSTSAHWVVEAGERLVGTMGCFADDSGRVHVVAVYLTPAYRGYGLLDRLLAEVAQWARERNVTTLVLTVAKENARAVRAYVRRGFVPTGHTHPHPLYPEITEMEMTRPVDSR